MKRIIASCLLIILVVAPTTGSAQTDALRSVYRQRADLQELFDANTLRVKDGVQAGFMLDLQDWAERYGWQEYTSLRDYGPEPGDGQPIRTSDREVEGKIGSHAYVVMDRSTGKILTVKQERREWPIASLTKLVTADVVLSEHVDRTQLQPVRNVDNVGGARLYVGDGERFSVDELFYATLVGSANNAANALSRSTGLSRGAFLSRMNAVADRLNLTQTRFTDPTGIEVSNVSNALEMTRLARYAYSHPQIQRYTTTSSRTIRSVDTGREKRIRTTNWMLYKPEFDDVYITGGKTGFLYESKWNVALSLRPSAEDTDRELIVVVFGADSRGDSFHDAERLAQWAWNTHQWQAIQ